MFKILSHEKSILGLEINEVAVKFMELSGSPSHRVVRAYSELAAPPALFSSGNIQDIPRLIAVVKQVLSKPKFGQVSTTAVIASIPETKSFVRLIEMPTMTEEEAKEAVPWEAEAYIPLPVGQVYLDWIILGSAKTSGKMRVFLTASPRDYVDSLMVVLKGAGLKPLALETESQALVRSLVDSPQETVLIADINALRTSLIIFSENTLQYTFSLPIAGAAFTQRIAQAMGVEMEEAEKIKQQVGLAFSGTRRKIEPEVRKALVPAIDNIVDEIKNAVRFFEEHSEEDKKISRLLLTGGSARLKHLPSFLQERLAESRKDEHALRSLPGIKVELGNPWVNLLARGQTPPLSREDSLSYATTIGLALRE